MATNAPASPATSRLGLRGRSSCPVVALGRAERAAITWSTSITTEATTAVASTRRDVPAVSGATTAAAIAACWNGSL